MTTGTQIKVLRIDGSASLSPQEKAFSFITPMTKPRVEIKNLFSNEEWIMAEQFETPVGLSAIGGTWNFSIDSEGNLELRSNSPSGEGEIRVRFNDDTGRVSVGSATNPAAMECHSELLLLDSADTVRVHLQAEDPSLQMFNSSGQTTASLNSAASLRLGSNSAAGDIFLFPSAATDLEDNNQATVQIAGSGGDLYLGSTGRDGDLYIRDSAARDTIHANGNNAGLRLGVTGNSGNLEIQDNAGRPAMHLRGSNAALYVGVDGNEGDVIVRDAAGREVLHMNGQNAALYVGVSGNEGDVIVRDTSGREVIHLDGGSAALYIGARGNEGDLIIRDAAGREVVRADANSALLRIGAHGNEGDLEVRDSADRVVMHMNGQNAALYIGAAGNEGDIILRDDDGNDSIHLNGGSGDIILRNADAAEKFDLAPLVTAPPGTVMVLDDEGLLRVADRAYDQRVVGVVAGAGAYKPGLVMNGVKSRFSQAIISMLGRVACKADASYGEIKVGDLLTTSPNAGHAMKVQDRTQAAGAIIGKAMSPLKSGCGLVTLMIALQ